MSIHSQNKARIFLEGLHKNEIKSVFDHLQGLVESLENKSDPDPIEMKLVNNIYNFLERLAILESNITSYSKDSNIDPLGTKLNSLYEDISYSGDIYRD